MGRVVILGAGASKHMGIPLLGEVPTALDAWIERLGQLRRGELWRDRSLPNLLVAATGLRRLQAARGREQNYEHLMSLAHRVAYGGARDADMEDFEAICADARWFDENFEESSGAHLFSRLVDAIESIVRFSADPTPHAVQTQWRFRQWLDRDGTTTATFNYDFILEEALSTRQRALFFPDSGSGAVHSEESDRFAELYERSFLKLHGSANWLVCRVPGCPRADEHLRQDVESFLAGRRGRMRLLRGVDGAATVDADGRPILVTGSRRVGSPHGPAPKLERSHILGPGGKPITCGCGGDFQALIVPPVHGKRTPEGYLGSVWRRLEDAIRDSERVFLIGVGLPDSDTDVRGTLIRYLQAATRCNEVIVVAPDAVRVASLLDAAGVPRLRALPMTLDAFLLAEAHRDPNLT